MSSHQGAILDHVAIETTDIDGPDRAEHSVPPLDQREEGNRPAARIISQIMAKVAWTYTAGIKVRGPHSWREHAQLVDARRDGPEVEALM